MTDAGPTTADIDLVAGYAPGVLAEVVGLHMAYYGQHWGFGLAFETKVAEEMAAFLRDADTDADADTGAGRDLLLCARGADGDLLGAVVIHGPHDTPDGREDAAHLRWFIVGDAARGRGVGRRLLDQAVAFCDARDYPLCYLTTFAGLDAARHLYERAGFRLVATSDVDQWSGGVQEQRFERRRGG